MTETAPEPAYQFSRRVSGRTARLYFPASFVVGRHHATKFWPTGCGRYVTCATSRPGPQSLDAVLHGEDAEVLGGGRAPRQKEPTMDAHIKPGVILTPHFLPSFWTSCHHFFWSKQCGSTVLSQRDSEVNLL